MKVWIDETGDIVWNDDNNPYRWTHFFHDDYVDSDEVGWMVLE